MRSAWNTRKIRKDKFDSSIDKKFLFVEGLFDALLVSSLGNHSHLTPIAVSYFAYNEQKKDYVVTETTQEGRGKKFVINRIKENHPNEFALVDMDHDYEQTVLNKISKRAVDTHEAMTLVGKIVKKLNPFIEAFVENLCEIRLITKGQASELIDNLIFANLQVQVLSMQRFLGHKKSVFNDNWTCQQSGKEIIPLFEELKSICPKNVVYINDHDLEEVMISFIQPTIIAQIVKRQLNSFILKLTKESAHQIIFDDEGINWI